MFYPPQNTQKVKHRTFTIDYTKTTFFVFDIIDSGYKLPFKDSIPTKCVLRSNRSALNKTEFVESSILQLLKDVNIEEQSYVPFCVNPLSVTEGKKKRLVLDFLHVNKFLHKPKFRYENQGRL